MMLSNEHYTTLIEIHNPKLWADDMYCNLLTNLKVDSDQSTRDTGVLIVQEAGKQVEWYAQSFDTQQSVESLLGRLDWTEEEEGSYQVYRDGELFYEVTEEYHPSADVRIVVLDKDTMEIVDHTYFTFQSELKRG